MEKVILSVADFLQEQKHDNIILLDASKVVDGTTKNEIIPGAIQFDLQSFKDNESLYPNTMLSPLQFQKQCQALGISNSSRVVVYDNKGIYTSPRVWWMLKSHGLQNVLILDGGLPEYKRLKGKLSSSYQVPVKQGDYKSVYNPEYWTNYSAVKQNSEETVLLHLDVRSAGRFSGNDPEPRPTLLSGCIPNSINLPYDQVLDNGCFKDQNALTYLFKSKGCSGQKLIVSCGSGITACIVLAAYYIAFRQMGRLYDGSWTEWAMKENLVRS